MLKQSVCIPMIKPSEVEDKPFFQSLSDIGFKAVEYWTCPDNIAEIAELCDPLNLAISSMIGHADIANGMNNPKEHSRIIKELEHSILLAEKYHITGLIIFSGNEIPGQSTKESIENCVTCLKEISPLAEEKNVLLNMELLNSLVDHPGYECDHTEWGLNVVKESGSTHVKLLYDIYHMQIMEGNLISTIEENLDSIGHFHTAGVPGRFDLDDDQEINYTAICKMLSRNKFPYFLGHEFKPKKAPLVSLKDAFTVCNQ